MPGLANTFITNPAAMTRLRKYLRQVLKSIKRSIMSRWASARLDHHEIELIKNIKAKKITYLSEEKLACIVTTINSLKQTKIEGAFIEAGCALGGSTVLIGKCKNRNVPLFVYDVFGLIPAPTEQDTKDVHERYEVIVSGKSTGIGGDEYYGYQKKLYETVISNLEFFGLDCQEDSITLIKGLLQETMVIKQPVAFAHIDVDWYEPVKFCIESICPKLVLGGSVIFDDYYDWGGCRKAVDEYLRTVVGQFALDGSAGGMKITRISCS